MGAKTLWMVADVKARLARDPEHRGLILVTTAARVAEIRAAFTAEELTRLTIKATD